MIKINCDEKLQTSDTGLYDKLLKNKDLGFLSLPAVDENWKLSAEFAESIAQNFDHLVVIGMGGSALGAKALVDSLGELDKVSFWSDSDPDLIKKQFYELKDLETTAWLLISKSGKTVEVMALVNYASQYYAQRGLDFFKNAFAITEKNESPIYELAKTKNLPHLEHPQNVGGRFSVFSPVGLVPAAFSNIDLNLLRQGANRALSKDTGMDLYSCLHIPIQKKSQVFYFWIYDSKLYSFGEWLEQLWAESLGQKLDNNEKGLPHFGVPIILHGLKDHHSSLQQVQDGNFEKYVVLFANEESKHGQIIESNHFSNEEYLSGLSLEKVHETFKQANIHSLKEKNLPFTSVQLNSSKADELSELMMAFEIFIGLLGQSYNFNPFEQPGVELCKKTAIEMLSQ